ncbi:hypothetical protein N1851_031710 [Merluccius polli]|uniref:Uncharacterized protein n=1 Tax=Merluccius polli TaxID=89951 RepID=A0AA47M3C1_MERPO|nr:hypothetical protein N1851_031710 [Merluccius polli]
MLYDHHKLQRYLRQRDMKQTCQRRFVLYSTSMLEPLYSEHWPGFRPSVSEGKPPLARHSSVALPCSSSTLEGGRTLSLGCTTPLEEERGDKWTTGSDSELSLNTPETVATMNPLSLLFWTVVCGSLAGTSSQVTVTQPPVKVFTASRILSHSDLIPFLEMAEPRPTLTALNLAAKEAMRNHR